MRRAFRFLLPAIVAIGAPLLFLAVAETALRVAGIGYEADFFLPLEGRPAVGTNPRYGWRYFPPAIARTPAPAQVTSPKPAGVYRIFVLGESAAMGVPDPAFGFGRILESLLRERYPGRRFEVINAAMTAVNSHAVRDIARACARLEPDLFLIYTGNNEVVGPFGAGTVFGGQAPPMPVVRAALWAKSLRSGQALSALLPAGKAPAEWGGMTMFLEQRVPAGDPRLERVYSHFQRNLEEICAAGRGAGARVLLSSVAVNLRDSPPFASMHRAGLTEAQRGRFAALFAAGQYAEAEQIDPAHAGLQFRLAEQRLAAGDLTDARRRFANARDADALRFRADSRINAIIRELARGGVELLDAERVFEEAGGDEAGGVPGERLFYEHVHLTYEGNRLLAEAAFARIAAGLGAAPGPAGGIAPSAWDLHRMAAEIHATMERPPFPGQLDYERRRQARAAKLQELATEVSLDEAEAAYRERLRRAPDDLLGAERLAELVAARGRHGEAAARWRALIARLPNVPRWHMGLADSLRAAGQPQNALAAYDRALELNPHLAAAQVGAGVALAALGRWNDAEERYRRALRLNPLLPEAHNNLGATLAHTGRSAEAAAAYAEAVRLRPSYVEAHLNLGGALAAAGRLTEAVPHYEASLRLEPGKQAARRPLAEVHYNLGVMAARRNDAAEAVERYREALRLEPDYAEAENNLGSAMARQGYLLGALPHLERAISLKPNYVEAHYNLGLALVALKRPREAAEHFAEALRLRPDFAAARAQLGSLTGGAAQQP